MIVPRKLTAVAIERMEDRVLFSKPFGTVYTPFGTPSTSGQATVGLQVADSTFGGAVRDAAGNVYVGGSGGVACFNSSGESITYGVNNLATIPAGYTFISGTVDSHDRYFVLVSSSSGVAVARFTAGGFLDRKFGQGGIADVTTDTSFSATAVAIDALGEPVVAGTGSTNAGQGAEMRVFRLHDVGTPDTSFGVSGVFSARLGTHTAQTPVIDDQVTGVRVQTDGSILVGGGSLSLAMSSAGDLLGPAYFTVAKISSAGQIDENYANGGIARLRFASAAALEGISDPQLIKVGGFDTRADGSVIVAGYSSIAAFNSAGVPTYNVAWNDPAKVNSPDADIAIAGIAALSNGGATLLTFDSDLVDAGITSISSDGVLGAHVTTFSAQDIGAGGGALAGNTPALVIEPTGKILIAGLGSNQYVVLAYNQGVGFTPAFSGFEDAANNSSSSVVLAETANEDVNQTAIAFYSPETDSLMFSQNLGNGLWTTPAVVAQTNGVNQSFSLALQAVANDFAEPSIAYEDPKSKTLKLVTSSNGGRSWTVITLDSTSNTGEFASLNFNTDGDPEVTYFDQTHDEVKIATEASNGKWSASIIESHVDVTDQTQSVFNADNDLSVAYFDAATSNIILAQQNSEGEWSSEVAAKVKKSATNLSLSLPDTSGISAFIAYDDTSRNELRDVTFDNSGSTVVFTDHTAAAGTFQDVSTANGSIYAYDPNSNSVATYFGGDEPDPQNVIENGGRYIHSVEEYPAGVLLSYVDTKTGDLALIPYNPSAT